MQNCFVLFSWISPSASRALQQERETRLPEVGSCFLVLSGTSPHWWSHNHQLPRGMVFLGGYGSVQCLPSSSNRPTGPLGRFDLVVAMFVCLSTCVFVPFPCDFFGVGELVHASLVRELVYASVAHAWSPKNGDHIQASHSLPLGFFLRPGTGACVPCPRTGVRVRRPRFHLITRVEP